MAHMTEIGLEAHMKKFEISRCHKYVEKGEEGEKEVEKCTTDFVEKEYRIPNVQEGFEDFIELSIPQPQRECRVFKLNIPDVICRVSTIFSSKLFHGYISSQDITTTECSQLSFLEDSVVEADLDIALPSEKPRCVYEVLSQMQKVRELDVILYNLIE